MKLVIDTDEQTICADGRAVPLYSAQGFRLLSDQWVKVGWTQKYSYSFTWLGRPIIQLPEDMIRIQELIWSLQPDVIVETGIAHGGSLIFYASLCRLMGKGRVVGVDVEIRPHNRQAIEAHPLKPLITLVEGDSVSPTIVSQVRRQVQPGERVLVILDSCHTKAHVLAELQAYAPLVTPGSYVVVTDGNMQELAGLPRAPSSWQWDNPQAAAREFLAGQTDFEHDPPTVPFNEGAITEPVTYWPSAYLRRCA